VTKLEKARKQRDRLNFRVNYLEKTAHFRKLTHEYCVKHKLCCTCAENATKRCSRPAYASYSVREGVSYACLRCYIDMAGLVKAEVMRAD